MDCPCVFTPFGIPSKNPSEATNSENRRHKPSLPSYPVGDAYSVTGGGGPDRLRLPPGCRSDRPFSFFGSAHPRLTKMPMRHKRSVCSHVLSYQRGATSIGLQLRRPDDMHSSALRASIIALASQIPPPTSSTKAMASTMFANRRSPSSSSGSSVELMRLLLA